MEHIDLQFKGELGNIKLWNNGISGTLHLKYNGILVTFYKDCLTVDIENKQKAIIDYK